MSAAEADGSWAFLDDVERLEVPADLAAALAEARPIWEDYPRSVRRGALEWLKSAKRHATRAARVAQLAEDARAGERPRFFRR